MSRVDAVCVNLGGTARAYSLLSQEKSGTGAFYFVKQIESETIHHLSTLSEICKGEITMAKIPHRLY
ncbi:hypothetical protein, partial [Agathobaculum sp.]|uniref:hypothetical protein n=1 Tax=Agathobaculum sp. TaxID=2048138 RepID=UPI003A912F46